MVSSSHPNDRFRDQTPKRQMLLRLFQSVGFGSVTFQVWDGQPDLKRPHHITRTLKLLHDDKCPRPEAASADFVLRHEHIALLAKLERLPDGTCVKVKVAHGLPGANIDLEEDHKAA